MALSFEEEICLQRGNSNVKMLLCELLQKMNTKPPEGQSHLTINPTSTGSCASQPTDFYFHEVKNSSCQSAFSKKERNLN